jgi:hypothetical protein
MTRLARLPDFLFFGTAALGAALVVSARYVPYADATNVLARQVLLEGCWFGTPPGDFQAALKPTPYVGLDLFAAVLVHLFSAGVAAKALALLALLLPPLGCYLLLCVTAPARRGWALVALLLSFNWFYFTGSVHYLVGWGLLLVWLSGYVYMKRHSSEPALVLLALTSPALLLVHLSAAIALLVIVGVDEVLAFGHAVQERSENEEAPLVSLATMAPVAVATPVLLLAYAMGRTLATPPEGAAPEFRPWPDKFGQLLTPFYSFSARQCVVMAGGYLLALAVFLVAYRRSLRPGPVGLSALAFLALYFAFPVAVGGTCDLDVRFLLPALLLPFCAEGAPDEAPGRRWWLLPWAVCLANFLLVAGPVRAIDGELAAYREALDRLPEGSAVLPLDGDDGRHGRVRPYRYFAHWLLIARRGRVPGTFAAPDYSFHDHFRRTGPELYEPEPEWGEKGWQPLDWAAIRSQYQYVILAGDASPAVTLVEEGARPVTRVGDVTVYRVEPAAPPTALTRASTPPGRTAGDRGASVPR